MSPDAATTPVVMSFSSYDPCGGTGIQADIESMTSVGCHCVPIITALTAQDTREIKDLTTVDPTLLIEQARAVLEDMPVKAFKLGMLANLENIEAIHTIISDYPDIPVVVDPVATMGSDAQIDKNYLMEAIQALLLPQATIATPNVEEARNLAHEADSIEACAAEILDHGCQHLLITGTRNTAERTINSLYSPHLHTRRFEWQRLPGSFQGAGATLAACTAAYLAHDFSLLEAVEQAQSFTWRSLKSARRFGMGRLIPNRMHWAQS